MDKTKIAAELVKLAKELTAGASYRVRIDGKKIVKELIGRLRGFDNNGIYYEHDEGLSSINGLEVVEQMLESLREVKDVRVVGERVVVTFDLALVREYMEGSGFRSMDYSEEDAKDDVQDNPISMLSSMMANYSTSTRVDPYDFQVEIKQPDYHEVTVDGETVYEGEDRKDAEKAFDKAADNYNQEDDEDIVWTINGERFAWE